MEPADKINLLEEEIKILKGEIKMILQDVRTALLARDNPFEVDAFSFATPSFAEPQAPEPQIARPSQVVVLAPPVAVAEPDPEPVTNTQAPAPSTGAASVSKLLQAKARQEAPPEEEPQPEQRNLTIQEMAVLMGWAQEAAGMLGRQDLDIVLSLARYGGLINDELQATLAELMEAIGDDNFERRATVNDFLLTLRQLDAALST